MCTPVRLPDEPHTRRGRTQGPGIRTAPARETGIRRRNHLSNLAGDHTRTYFRISRAYDSLRGFTDEHAAPTTGRTGGADSITHPPAMRRHADSHAHRLSPVVLREKAIRGWARTCQRCRSPSTSLWLIRSTAEGDYYGPRGAPSGLPVGLRGLRGGCRSGRRCTTRNPEDRCADGAFGEFLGEFFPRHDRRQRACSSAASAARYRQLTRTSRPGSGRTSPSWSPVTLRARSCDP